MTVVYIPLGGHKYELCRSAKRDASKDLYDLINGEPRLEGWVSPAMKLYMEKVI